MDAKTRAALHDLNRRFYDRFARQFSGTRQRPWLGWKRLLDHLGPPPGDSFRVLDVGCGNGRFGIYLAESWAPGFRYVGCDACTELLRLAELSLRDLLPAPELRQLDLLAEGPASRLPEGSFELIVSFGVMHHVPDRTARLEHLKALARSLAPGGLLAVSIWRFDRNPRFASRLIPWPPYLALHADRGLPQVSIEQLEAGDVLLGWAGDFEHPRYCHFPNDTEISDWIEALDLPLEGRFDADGSTGKDNTYLLFRAAPESARRLC